MRRPSIPCLLAGSLLLPLAAQAQHSPSASQIIQSLTPSGNLSGGSTRGIRLANPTGPTESSPAQAPAAMSAAPQPGPSQGGAAPAAMESHPPSHPHMRMAAERPSRPPSVNLNVDFATGSADLTSPARSTLDQLGQALSSQQLAGYRFRIVGHTDTVGAPGANRDLSERRARAVAEYLEQKFNVPRDRLQTLGVGEKGLLVPTPPQTPNEQNRRVEVINLGA